MASWALQFGGLPSKGEESRPLMREDEDYLALAARLSNQYFNHNGNLCSTRRRRRRRRPTTTTTTTSAHFNRLDRKQQQVVKGDNNNNNQTA